MRTEENINIDYEQIESLLSWVEYKGMAEANGIKLVPSTSSTDSSLLAWAPLKS